MNHDRRLITAVLTATAAIAGVGASLGVAMETADAAAAAAPDLVVAKATFSGTSITEGATLSITHTVRNAGTASAGSSATRFYLTKDPAASKAARKASRTNPRSSPTDILLEGSASIAAIKPGKSSSSITTKARVPVGTAAATYSVLACADDRGAVRESTEPNNCAVAGKVAVKTAAGTGAMLTGQFADTTPWPADEQDSYDHMRIFCQMVTPAKSFTLKSAIASTNDWLADSVGADALSQLRSSGQAATPEAAQELAATAVAGGSPGLALASLLEAHRLQPRNATHLINAAGLAVSLGLPNQALAFLDASVAGDTLRPALGISQRAIALTTRGQALAMTGRLDPARRAFAAAKQAAPLLSEADAGLATVAACKGEKTAAMRFARRSRLRSPQQVPTTPPTSDPEQPEPQIDYTLGPAMPLRQVPIPQTPTQAADMRDLFEDMNDGVNAEVMPHVQERNALEQHLRDTDHARTDAEIERRDTLLLFASLTYLATDVQAAKDAYDDISDEMFEQYGEFWGQGTGEVPHVYIQLQDDAFEACEGSEDPNCFEKEINRTCRPALVTAHQAFIADWARLQDAADAYVFRLSRRMSGVASNLLDEEAHRLVLLDVEMMESDLYSGLIKAGLNWIRNVEGHRDYCVEPLPPEVLNPPPAPGAAPSPGLCAAGGSKVSLKATLGPTSLKINCESVEQSFSHEVIPLLAAYASAKYDMRTGNMTFFAGAKAGGKVGNIVDLGFKSGIYMTSDKYGNITDVGWRVGPSASVVNGQVELSAYKDEIDISFVPAFSTHW